MRGQHGCRWLIIRMNRAKEKRISEMEESFSYCSGFHGNGNISTPISGFGPCRAKLFFKPFLIYFLIKNFQ
jgi:hypothetical protein